MRKYQALLVFCVLIAASSGALELLSSEFFETSFSDQKGWNAEYWSASHRFTNCGGKTLYGGYGLTGPSAFAHKTYTSTKPIKYVTVQVKFYMIDTWDGDNGWGQDAAFLVFNSAQNQQTYRYTKGHVFNDQPNICGNGGGDRILSINVRFEAKDVKEFKLLFKSGQNQAPDDESWGFRELNVWIEYGENFSVPVVNELNEAYFNEIAWKMTGGRGDAQSSQCGNFIFLGGFNIAGAGAEFKRVEQNLPAHSYVNVNFKVMFIDSWDWLDYVRVLVDGQYITELHDQQWNVGTRQCGNVNDGLWAEGPSQISLLVPHTSSQVEVVIQVRCNQASDDESLGIREFQINVDSQCSIGYSQANYQGQRLNICGSIPNLKQINWTAPIKSIYVPTGQKLQIFKQSDYQGTGVTVNESQATFSNSFFVELNSALGLYEPGNTQQTLLRVQN